MTFALDDRGRYVYNNIPMNSGFLSSMFYTHGYCVDPTSNTGQPFPEHSLNQLMTLACSRNDSALAEVIRSMRRSSVPSPRREHDNIMLNSTHREKERYCDLSIEHQDQTVDMLRNIVHLSLYFLGWSGPHTPYPTTLVAAESDIRLSLRVQPLAQSIVEHDHYSLIKNFPLVSYRTGKDGRPKPQVVNTDVDIDSCLTEILTHYRTEPQVAHSLLTTGYYYLTTVCATPLPGIEPLLMGEIA